MRLGVWGVGPEIFEASAERSRDDELNRTVQADIPLFVVAFVLMAPRFSGARKVEG